MSDIIHLLSDHIANQIAAGEVIQRPASAVKELLENAIDAEASEIQLVIKDAGKELIQVIDNGKGMSPTDARMSFERHATSKIRKIEDLFSIKTMGFRGEALPSMAAVGQIELRSKREEDEIGTHIIIEGTQVKSQESVVCPNGTNIMLKNLFFNVPARRNFLKSNTTELRNIVEEFSRVALAFPSVSFKYFNNGVELYHLLSGSLKARIISLFGKNFDKKLIPVSESTDFLRIEGFVGIPDASAKTRGMQYFFLNNRFIKNHFLNHALVQAYEGLIPKDSFPIYFLFLTVDSSKVDINVHPTKQEVKFDDDRLMYAYLNASVKHALARNNMSPALDFTLNADIQQLSSVQIPQNKKDVQQVQKGYLSHEFAQKNSAHFIPKSNSLNQWKQLYESKNDNNEINNTQQQVVPLNFENTNTQSEHNEINRSQENNHKATILLFNSYLISYIKSGLIYINIRRAKERIIYERMIQQLQSQQVVVQKLVFPEDYEALPQDVSFINENLIDFKMIGFDMDHFGKNTFVIRGTPIDIPVSAIKDVIDEIIELCKNENYESQLIKQQKMILQCAKKATRYNTNFLHDNTREVLIDELFACQKPEYSPSGKKIFNIITQDDFDKMLNL